MQYNNDGNCNYCGFGPTNRAPSWDKCTNICVLSHLGEPLDKAHNIKKWKIWLIKSYYTPSEMRWKGMKRGEV